MPDSAPRCPSCAAGAAAGCFNVSSSAARTAWAWPAPAPCHVAKWADVPRHRAPRRCRPVRRSNGGRALGQDADGLVTESLAVTDDGISGVRLHDGRAVAVRAVVVPPNAHARADVLVSLGLRTTSQQFGTQSIGTYVPATDPTGATEVAGVWLAGNVTNLAEQVIGAAAAGVNTAAAINADLVSEDTRHAVAFRRSR